jgi:hypothetical protein
MAWAGSTALGETKYGRVKKMSSNKSKKESRVAFGIIMGVLD